MTETWFKSASNEVKMLRLTPLDCIVYYCPRLLLAGLIGILFTNILKDWICHLLILLHLWPVHDIPLMLNYMNKQLQCKFLWLLDQETPVNSKLVLLNNFSFQFCWYKEKACIWYHVPKEVARNVVQGVQNQLICTEYGCYPAAICSLRSNKE